MRRLEYTVAAVHFDEWRRSATSFENLSLLAGPTVSVTGSGDPENVPGAKVSANRPSPSCRV